MWNSDQNPNSLILLKLYHPRFLFLNFSSAEYNPSQGSSAKFRIWLCRRLQSTGLAFYHQPLIVFLTFYIHVQTILDNNPCFFFSFYWSYMYIYLYVLILNSILLCNFSISHIHLSMPYQSHESFWKIYHYGTKGSFGKSDLFPYSIRCHLAILLPTSILLKTVWTRHWSAFDSLAMYFLMSTSIHFRTFYLFEKPTLAHNNKIKRKVL